MPKPYLILLNGPPGSGKDYAAQVLSDCDDLMVEVHKFAAPLKTTVSSLVGVTNNWIEGNKGLVVQPYGVTIRQMLIDMSEVWFKPQYGKDIFGRLAAHKVEQSMQFSDAQNDPIDLYVFSDSGFAPEAEEVIKLFGSDNTLLVRLHRDGHTFEGDSRSYISIDGVDAIDITNTGGKAFNNYIVDVVKNWLETKETVNV